MKTIRELGSLQGRRVLLTGATGALGRIMCDALAEVGAELVLVDRPGTDFQPLAGELQQRWGTQVRFRHCDLEQEEQRLDLIRWMTEEVGGLNVLVNNAAFVGASALQGWAVPFDDQSVSTWCRALEVNLTAAFSLCKGLRPLLDAAPGANIVNIASIYGVIGPDWSLYHGTTIGNPAAYAASKGGLIQLTRWLATTLGPRIRVNAITLGGIFRQQAAAFVARYEAGTPLGRMATEEDFKGAICFLASDLSAYVTGHNLVVDGGRTVL